MIMHWIEEKGGQIHPAKHWIGRKSVARPNGLMYFHKVREAKALDHQESVVRLNGHGSFAKLQKLSMNRRKSVVRPNGHGFFAKRKRVRSSIERGFPRWGNPLFFSCDSCLAGTMAGL